MALQRQDPAQVGPFRLLGRLGAGGMGQVFLGEGEDGARVAVKLVHPGLAYDARFRARFAREVEAGMRVTGRWTAAVVAADASATQPWLATEYVPGLPLDRVVNVYGALPRATVHVLARRLAQALAAVHEAGLLHRDIKPSNVLLAADGPRLIDFGIAHAVDGTQLTSTGMVIGTPAFMSPEQADGAELAPASDVFSLGAVLVLAATGTGPFGSAAPVVLMRRILTADPDLGALEDPVRALVARCLSRDPAARPSAADLAAVLAAEPETALDDWLPAEVVGTLPRPDRGDVLPQGAGSGPGAHPEEPGAAPARGAGLVRRRVLLGAGALAALGGVGVVAATVGDRLATAARPEPRVRWSFTADSDVAAMVVDGATLYLSGAAASLQAVDVATGVSRWTRAVPYPVDVMAVAGSTVFVNLPMGYDALDSASGSQRWNRRFGSVAAATAEVVVAEWFDSRLGPDQPRMTVLLETGAETPRWTRPHRDTGIDAIQWGMLTGDAIHLSGSDMLVTLDMATGATLWSRPIGLLSGFDETRTAVSGDSVYLAEDRSDSGPARVVAVDPRSGGERWGVAFPSYAPALLAAHGDVVYGTASERLWALDSRTGEQRWMWSDAEERGDPLLPDRVQGLGKPARVGDTVHVLGSTGPGAASGGQPTLIALDAAAGRSQWRMSLPVAESSATPRWDLLAAPDGALLVLIGRTIYSITAG